MERINKADYTNATAYLNNYFQNQQQANDRVAFFTGADVFIDEKGEFLYICDREKSEAKYYRDHSSIICNIYRSVRDLYVRNVGVKTGNSKGMNTAYYDDIDKIEFLYGPIAFHFKDIRDLFFNIEKARYGSGK